MKPRRKPAVHGDDGLGAVRQATPTFLSSDLSSPPAPLAALFAPSASGRATRPDLDLVSVAQVYRTHADAYDQLVI
jgi:hypothetical protein